MKSRDSLYWKIKKFFDISKSLLLNENGAPKPEEEIQFSDIFELGTKINEISLDLTILTKKKENNDD